MLSNALDMTNFQCLQIYGALSGLCELGSEVQRTFVMKRLKMIGDRISDYLDNGGAGADKSAADHIKQLILRVMPQI